VDVLDGVGPREREQIVATLERARMIFKLRAAKRRLVELQRLDHRAHRAVDDEDAPGEEVFQFFRCRCHCCYRTDRSDPTDPSDFPATAFSGAIARATKISTARLPLRLALSPA